MNVLNKIALYSKATDMGNMIGELIPKNKITLLHGRSGCGKTLGILKYLISNNIKPLFIDFDYNDEYTSMDIDHIDGYKLLKYMFDNIDDRDKLTEVKNDFKNRVVVVDTYAKCNIEMQSYTEGENGVEDFCTTLIDSGATVIVIAHTTYYSMKPAEPDVNIQWANHLGARLHLYKNISKKSTEQYLIVEKLRNYSGPDKIVDWMVDR